MKAAHALRVASDDQAPYIIRQRFLGSGVLIGVLGDSITARQPAEWNSYFQPHPYSVGQESHGGFEATQMAAMATELASFGTPHRVVTSGGRNDVTHGNTLAQIQTAFASIATRFPANTLVPITQPEIVDAVAIAALNTWFRSGAFVGYIDWAPVCMADHTLLLSDLIHPSEKGQPVLAALALSTINALG